MGQGLTQHFHLQSTTFRLYRHIQVNTEQYHDTNSYYTLSGFDIFSCVHILTDLQTERCTKQPMAARHCSTEIIVHNRIRVDQNRYKRTPQQLSNTQSKQNTSMHAHADIHVSRPSVWRLQYRLLTEIYRRLISRMVRYFNKSLILRDITNKFEILP